MVPLRSSFNISNHRGTISIELLSMTLLYSSGWPYDMSACFVMEGDRDILRDL